MTMQMTNAMRATMLFDTSSFTAEAKRAVQVATGMAGQVSGAWDRTSAAVAENSRSYGELRASIDPVYAASKRYEAAQRTLTRALEAGAISQGEMSQTLDLAAKRYLAPVAGAQRLSLAQGSIAASSNRMTSAVTNASFQVQDFAVQVASGTAATTAMAQQLPQLLGAFGMTGKIALFGSILGTLVAVGAAVIPKIDGAGAAVKGFLVSVSDYPVIGGMISAVQVLGENVDQIAVYAGTAAAIFTGKWAVGALAAAVATGSFSGALVVLRGALIRTGVGALVVGAGELTYQFLRLMKATGSFGAAMGVLGDAAVGVWNGIVTSASAIPPGLAATWESVKSDFLYMLSGLTAGWRDFLKGFGLDAMADAADAASTAYAGASNDALVAAGDLSAAASAKITDGFDQAKAAVSALTGIIKNGDHFFGLPSLNGGLKDAAKNGKKTASELSKLKDFADGWKDKLDPTREYRREFEKLAKAMNAGYLSAEEYEAATWQLNVQLADSLPLVGDLVDGLSNGLFEGFSSTMSNIGQSFKKWLASLIATAMKNRIVLSMGVSGGMTGAASAGTGVTGSVAQSGLTSLLGSGIGWASSFASGITGPLQSAISATMNSGLTSGWNAFQSSVNASSSGVFGGILWRVWRGIGPWYLGDGDWRRYRYPVTFVTGMPRAV